VTDFIAELEAELVDAARRRGARRPLPRVRPGLVLRVALAVAVVAALIGAVALLGRPGTGRDHGAAPPAGRGLPVPGSVAAGGQLLHACAAQARSLPVGDVPAMLMRRLAVLRRPQTEADPLPEVPDISRWLPVGAYDPSAVRRLGPLTGAPTRPVYIVPTSDLRNGPMACGRTGSFGPGACLVAGESGAPILYGCFRAADVLAGRAAIREAGGPGARLHILAPDGTLSVGVEQGTRHWSVGVAGNLAQRYLPLRPQGVRLTLVGSPRGCGVSVDPRLARAIAALRTHVGAAPPASLGDAVSVHEGGRIGADAARIAGGGDGITYWIVPAAFPDDTPCAPLRRACVIPVTSKPVGAPACADARDARFGGGVIAGPLRGQTVVYGVVPDRVARVRITAGGRSGTVDVAAGVAAGLLPLPWHDTGDVRFSYVARPDAPVVALLNATRVGGLATHFAGRLEREAFRRGVIGTYPGPRSAACPPACRLTRTRIEYAPGHAADAQAVRRVLHAGAVGALDPAARRALTGSGPLPDVTVVLGEDLAARMR
jgi:LytR cell envelope-related transcriptional attenuator